MDIPNKSLLQAGLKAGGAVVMWKQIMTDALPEIKRLVPEGSHVLEVGYGDGLLSCYLAKELGWSIVGIDISPEAYKKAVENAARLNLEDRVKFLCCKPEETQKHQGEYDAVFIKTVLYHSKILEEYAQWLDWIHSLLKPKGVLINFETGKGNKIVQLYRKLRNREYSDWLLYTKSIEKLYDNKFDILYRKYYGGISQFFAPISFLYKIINKIEFFVVNRNAENCFAVAIIGQKRNGGK